MESEKIKTTDKEQIQKVVEGFFSALCNKDVKRMMSYYASDVVVFDCKPPFQTKGAVAWRHTWEACIGYFPLNFKTEVRDLKIHVSGDLAIAHSMFRIIDVVKDDPTTQTWMRTTTGYKRVQGKWKIIHEHGSLPFNPHTKEAVFTLEP